MEWNCEKPIKMYVWHKTTWKWISYTEEEVEINASVMIIYLLIYNLSNENKLINLQKIKRVQKMNEF